MRAFLEPGADADETCARRSRASTELRGVANWARAGGARQLRDSAPTGPRGHCRGHTKFISSAIRIGAYRIVLACLVHDPGVDAGGVRRAGVLRGRGAVLRAGAEVRRGRAGRVLLRPTPRWNVFWRKVVG